MPWWSVLRDALRRPRAGSSAAADQPSVQRHSAPEPGPAASFSPPAEQAWQDLPALQRTLAEPIEPAAPLDVFTGSLVAHHNPSFLAPLGHRVDPVAGGLVDGLADLSPGHPISYSAAGELAVPQAAGPAVQRKTAVQRTLAEWPSNGAGWLGGDEVDTVPMERPGVAASAGSAGVVTGHGTGDAPLALAAPTPSPAPPQPVVQRHAVAATGEPEEPADAGTAGMEAMEGLTVSRLTESTALSHQETQLGSAAPSGTGASGGPVVNEADVPTIGRTGKDPLTGLAAAPMPARTNAGGKSTADPAEVSGAAGRGGLPVASVQRKAAQAADLGIRRTWPVVSEQVVPAAAFPALPAVELPVARTIESGAPSVTQADSPAASDIGLASANTDAATTDGAEPTDAPLSGFAAAISALQAGDGDAQPVQRSADSAVDGTSVGLSSAAGAEGPASAPAGMPVQRLAVGPGEFVQARAREFRPGDQAGREGERLDSAETAGSTSAPVASGLSVESAATSAAVGGGWLVDELPELPPIAPDRPAAARGSVAMPVVGATPVQRSADRSGWTPVRTAGLLSSRVPALQLQQLSSATPAPPPAQRVTFLADAVPPGAVAQRLPAPIPTATTAGHSTGGQYGSGGAGSAGPAARTLQRSFASTASSPHFATATDSVSGAPASRADQFDAFESSPFGYSGRWEPVPLEQAADGSTASADYDIDQPAVVQRAVELPAAAATGTTSARSGSWPPADAEAVALDAYQAVRSVEPPVPPRHPATVMPPMPIVQRHAAAAESAPARPHRSSSAGMSFASMFSAATEAAETGYTTVQLHAADSSPAVEATEPEAASNASTADFPVQREGEAPPTSTPAPGSGAPAGGAPAGADLDEMARRLFEPLSARLRAEFWLDRERAGLMTDARP